jgi:Ca-activated chloride channel family protein
MFTLADPYYLLLLMPAVAAIWRVYGRRIRQGLLFSAVPRVPFPARTWRVVAARILPALVLAGLLLAILALARPRIPLSGARRTADSIAIEMVVDVSGSMAALDLSPSSPTGITSRTRLDVVKDTFAEFVRRRPDDQIGLITFGGYAATRVPLTYDHRALLHVLGGVEVPREGQDPTGLPITRDELLTAIGDALATACARLEQAEPRSRIVVLLTDGVSNTGITSPEEAAGAAARLGLKVYAIGVGSTGRSAFRGRDMFGRDTIEYDEVSLDEALLQRMASRTGGRYFRVSDRDGLQSAMRDIDRLEKTRIQHHFYDEYDEFFPWVVWPALGLILAGVVLNVSISGRPI